MTQKGGGDGGGGGAAGDRVGASCWACGGAMRRGCACCKQKHQGRGTHRGPAGPQAACACATGLEVAAAAGELAAGEAAGEGEQGGEVVGQGKVVAAVAACNGKKARAGFRREVSYIFSSCPHAAPEKQQRTTAVAAAVGRALGLPGWWKHVACRWSLLTCSVGSGGRLKVATACWHACESS
jgi:hypothetical protein